MLKQTFFLIAITMQAVCAQPKTKITVTDMTRIKNVGGIKLTPDGQRAPLATDRPVAQDLRVLRVVGWF